MEARVAIESTIEDLQSSALPLGDRAITDVTSCTAAGRLGIQVNFIANFTGYSVAPSALPILH